MNDARIHTYFRAQWHEGNLAVIGATDHATWGGSAVFDGARSFEGVVPDLQRHCERLNHSAAALGMKPTQSVPDMVQIVHDGLGRFSKDSAIYIRPVYWSVARGAGFIDPDPESTEFCIGLEHIPMPPENSAATLTTTRFCRPTLDNATVNAKAACLYPNNARMIREAMAKGFSNALVADALGNVAETATSNIFMTRDGEILTPVPNGTFLNGVTRQRHISLFRASGTTVREVTLTFDDFRQADEVFMAGNLAKVTPVSAFDDTRYEIGPIARQARQQYWDWAHSK